MFCWKSTIDFVYTRIVRPRPKSPIATRLHACHHLWRLNSNHTGPWAGTTAYVISASVSIRSGPSRSFRKAPWYTFSLSVPESTVQIYLPRLRNSWTYIEYRAGKIITLRKLNKTGRILKGGFSSYLKESSREVSINTPQKWSYVVLLSSLRSKATNACKSRIIWILICWNSVCLSLTAASYPSQSRRTDLLFKMRRYR